MENYMLTVEVLEADGTMTTRRHEITGATVEQAGEQLERFKARIARQGLKVVSARVVLA